MIIPVSEKVRIRGTETCWQLERRRRRKGALIWEPYKYFGTFRQALTKAGDDEIRLHPAANLTEAIEAVADISRRYGELLGANLDEADEHQAAIRQHHRGAA